MFLICSPLIELSESDMVQNITYSAIVDPYLLIFTVMYVGSKIHLFWKYIQN